MLSPVYQVNVPTRDSSGRSGLHVFTGNADNHAAAVRIARDVYESAAAAQRAGLPIPDRRPDGWAARAVRPGWHLEWAAATVGLWSEPHTFTRVDGPES
ncbi:hypothetical protein [Streptomyces nodosus]|uniref:hypothetical protein n=1 Tax=Streptomyces nodosus TaxID=40318 RepID=UPI00380D4BD8